MNQDKIMKIVLPLLIVGIFGGILITGYLGISLQEEESERYLVNCLRFEQCIQQVKTMRNDSYNCYSNKKCRKAIEEFNGEVEND